MEDPLVFSKYPELPSERDLFLSKNPNELLNRYTPEEVEQILNPKLEREKLKQPLKGTTEELVEQIAEQIAEELAERVSEKISKEKSEQSLVTEADQDQRKKIFLHQLWVKYQRIDLVQWDISLKAPFFDYASSQFQSFDYLIANLKFYPYLAVERLLYQLQEYQADPRNGLSLVQEFKYYQQFEILLELCQRIVTTETFV